jgi:hypothetical protein
MPTVPRAERREVATAGPRVRVSENVPGDSFGGSLGAAEQLAADIYEQERLNANKLVQSEGRRALNELENSLIYDPETGAKYTRGKDSFGVPDDLEKGLDDFSDEYSKGLANDEQRGAFTQLVDARRESWRNWGNGHVATQRVAYEKSEYEAGLESSKERGSVNPANVPIERAMLVQSVLDRSDRMGWSEEETAQELQEHETDLHSRVIGTMLADKNDIAAQEYFDTVADRLDPDKAKELRETLKEGSLRGESQRQSEEIFARELPKKEALAIARDIKDPELKDMAVKRVKALYTEKEAAEKDELEELYLDAVNLMEKNPDDAPRDVIEPEVWMRLSVAQRKALETRGADDNNDEAWLEFFFLDAVKRAELTPAEFDEKYWAKLDSAHRTRAETLMKESRKAAAKGVKSATLTSAISFQGRAKNVWEGMQLGVKTPEEKADFARFEEEAAKRLEEFEINDLEGKRKATGEEVQKIVDGVAIEKVTMVTDPGWFWDTRSQVVAATLTPEERETLYEEEYVKHKDVPAGDIALFTTILQQRGIPVTEYALEKLYNADRVYDRKRFESILEKGTP